MLSKSTKFWCFLYNALITILALVYSSFSTSIKLNKMHDLMRKHKSFSVRSRYPETIKTRIIPEEQAAVVLQEKGKITHQGIRTLENRLPINVAVTKPGKQCRVDFQEKRSTTNSLNRFPEKIISGQDVLLVRKRATGSEKRKNISSKTLRRSKSDNIKRVVIDESKNIVWRVKTVRYEPSEVESDEERDNYACMSNEELNRRVEDFIKRFNMQIRLQRSGAALAY